LEYSEEQKKMTAAYNEVFGTEHGRKVLQDLENFCGFNRCSVYEQKPDANQTMFAEGKRRVYLRIKSIMERK